MESEKENSDGEWVPVEAVTPERKGLFSIEMGTFAVMIWLLCCCCCRFCFSFSPSNFRDSFIMLKLN